MTLEIELGVTGGEEDGVDNTGIDHAKLYTQPSDVLAAYDALSPIGSVHGRRLVRQHARRLRARQREADARNPDEHQEHIRRSAKHRAPNPVNFVFHGGSGSSPRGDHARPSPTAS